MVVTVKGFVSFAVPESRVALMSDRRESAETAE
jgi:hypothetical protein